MEFVITYETMHTLPNHTKTFLNDFFERAPDRHDLTYRLHARTDFTRYTGKLRQVPTRDLTDIIVKLRSNICRVRSSHLTNLVERVTQSNFGCDKCQRITGSLRSQSGRTAQTSVYFNHTVIIRIRVESILNITFTYDT